MPDLAPLTEQLLKPTATIHVGNKLSLIERKLFNAIIWHSQKSRFTRASDTLSLGLLMLLIGLERSKNVDVIKEALERLTTTPIVWNTLKKDRTTDWGVCTFLAGAEISRGVLRYVLNPLLVEKVNNPILFAKIQLLVQTQFSSKYSLALYEFLLDELGRAGSPPHQEIQVSLEILRHVLQFEGIYKHLHGDVLKPCIQEINQYADITVGYRGVKKGRAVVAIVFAIDRAAGPFPPALEPPGLSEPEDPLLSQSPWVATLVGLGVAKRKAEALVATYEETRIRDNLAHAEAAHTAGKVKNLPAYLIRAIEADYRPTPTPEERCREAEASLARACQDAREAQEARRREWHDYRARRTRARFASLPEEQQTARRQAFVEKLQGANPVLHERYRKMGFASGMVEGQFFAELSEDLLVDPAETHFSAYLENLDVASPQEGDAPSGANGA